MITATDFAPLVGTVGGGFFLGFLAGFAIKKVIRFAAIIIGIFIAAIAYLEYQRIVNVDWDRIQIWSQTGITWVTGAITHISNNIGAPHVGVSNVGIPLLTSASGGFALGMARG
jgi:uncharacterized membrane protein (Fun14 family)